LPNSAARLYATAAGAPSPRAIVTDLAGLDAGMAQASGQLPLYYAKPEGLEGLPVVLVAQEIFGLHEHIRDIVRRLAKLGYFAVAPDYFFRHGDPLSAPDIAAIRAIVNKVPDAEAMADFDAALAFAANRGGDAARAAVTGFCWGGRMAWLYAEHNARLKAAAPWYGRLDGDRTPAQPRWPIDLAATLKVPCLGFYGGADASIPLDVVEDMRIRLRAAAAPCEIVVYDAAPHAFFADYRDSYREVAAKDGWRRMLEWFARWVG
jgi:carboxymethylenebutenolidase